MITIKKLKITIGIKAAILISCLAGLYFMNAYFSKNSEKYLKQERSINSKLKEYQRDIDNFNTKSEDIEEAMVTWDILTSEKSAFTGLDIGVARKILDELKLKYEFKDLDIKMSKPFIMPGQYRGKKISAEASDINIVVRGLTDVEVMMFIYDLKTRFPGYFKVNSYTIKQEQAITKDFFSSLSKGTSVSSVHAKLDLSWRELKEQ